MPEAETPSRVLSFSRFRAAQEAQSHPAEAQVDGGRRVGASGVVIWGGSE